MQILNALDHLINDVTIVQIFKDFLSYCIMQICFHILKDQVQVFIVLGTDHSVKFYNVLMVDLMQEDYLAIGTLSIC